MENIIRSVTSRNQYLNEVAWFYSKTDWMIDVLVDLFIYTESVYNICELFHW